MAKTNLKYFDPISLRVYTVYVNKSGYHYIRRNNERIWIDPYDIFNPQKMPKLNRDNLARYLRKQIKQWDEDADDCKRRKDYWNMNRAIGRRDAFKYVLEYVMKLQEA